jgi:site-specific recombinase
LDAKTQKYKELKEEMRKLKEQGMDKDTAFARLKEEVEINKKAKADSEAKLKKFEAKFRQAVSEIEELRE